MKRIKIIGILLAMLIVFCLALSYNERNEELELWVSGSGINAEGFTNLSLEAVSYQQVGDEYYLFLPSGVERSSATIYVKVGLGQSVYIDGNKLSNGINKKIDLSQESITVSGNSYDTITINIMQSANIGTVYLTMDEDDLVTLNTSETTDVRIEQNVQIAIYDEAGNLNLQQSLDYIQGRGNTTWTESKKPYQIKFDNATEVLGMESAEKWILLANAADNTLIHNQLALDIAKEMGLEYTPDSIFVDVYQNGAYVGNYTLCEKVEVGENRVEIQNLDEANLLANTDLESLEDATRIGELEESEAGTIKYFDINSPEDITGGYLLELEHSFRYPDELSGFVTTGEVSVVIKSPEYASQSEVEYISSLFNNFELALMSEDGMYNGVYYYEIVDIDSLIYKYLLDEFMQSCDGFMSSTYFYKPEGEDSLIYAGPAWDYDISMGLAISDTPADEFWIKGNNRNIWVDALFTQPYAMERMEEIYVNEVKAIFDITDGEEPYGEYLKDTNYYFDLIEESAAMNYTIWSMKSTEMSACPTTKEGTYEYVSIRTDAMQELLEEYFD